jgi:hypothetical protein
MAITKHNPDKVFPENKGVLKMKKSSLKDFESTKLKGLPGKIKSGKNALAKIADGKGSDILQSIAKRRKK